jgi:hypothetical protein
MKLQVFGFVASNFDNNLWCPYGEDARCLALLNPAFGRATRGGIQQGEVSGYWFLKVNILFLSSIKHPVSII